MPAEAYWGVAVLPEAVAPSPKVQLYETIEPREAVALKLIASGAVPYRLFQN